MGQLGGRRRDPRRRHRPVHRPRQAALHRLRGPHFRSRARRSRPARRRASRVVGPRPPGRARTGWSARSADVGYVTPRDADARRARSSTRSAARRRRPGARRRPCTSSPTWWSSSTRTRPAARDRKARLDDLAGAEYTQRRHRSSPARRPASPTCSPSGSGPGLTGFRLRPGALPHDLTAITRGLVPELQRRGAVPHRLRGRHPARPARPAPPRQPLRRPPDEHGGTTRP